MRKPIQHEERCSEQLWHHWHTIPCARRGVVTRDGKLWCKQHDPEAVKARREKADEAWREERARRERVRIHADNLKAAREKVINCAVKWAHAAGTGNLSPQVDLALQYAVNELNDLEGRERGAVEVRP